MKVVVLGAGVVGVCAAYWLQEAGHAVTLVERRPGAGLETSWGNGAIVHVSSVQPWSAPGLPRQLLGWVGRRDAPFGLRLRDLPRTWRWGLAFLRECDPHRHRANAEATLTLALETLAALAAIRQRTGILYDRRDRAVLKTYGTTESFRRAAAAYGALAPLGLVTEVWDRDACLAREPALRPAAERLAGGLFFPQDEVGCCHTFTSDLAAWCAAAGVTVRYGTTALGLEVQGGQVRSVRTDAGPIAADAVVLALGPGSNALLGPLGLRLPICPVKGVSFTFARARFPSAPSLAILDDAGRFALTPVGSRLRAVGTADIGRRDPVPEAARLADLAAGIDLAFPGFRAAAEHPDTVRWAGLRPYVPAGVPRVGPGGIEGLWLDTGHGHIGWTTAAGSGRRLAAMLGGASRPPDATM